MESLSLSPLAQSSKAVPLVPFSLLRHSLRWSNHHPYRLLAQKPSPRRIIVNSASAARIQQTHKEISTLLSHPNWSEFAGRVSGEWDGFGAEFSSRGEPIQLPDNVVPEAFKEWEVQVFDWQTQCPTLAEYPSPSFLYKLIKLLPTVGCEADAATRHSTEEKTLQNSSNFAYDQTGNYVAIWPQAAKPGAGIFEIEHCLRHPKNQEVRIRVIQKIKKDEKDEKDFGLRVAKIEVFSEQWYGPYRNGEQLGGCSIRESGFAATPAIEESRVRGTWKSVSVAANFSDSNAVTELGEERREKRIRVAEGLVTLPKQLWSSIGKKDDDDRWVEVGWMVDHGHAVTSRCIFSEDGNLKEITVGQEALIPDDTTSQ